MAHVLSLLEDSDRLLLNGAPEAGDEVGEEVGDWIVRNPASGSMAAFWMLRLERPDEYYSWVESDTSDPLLSRIEVSVELLPTAPLVEPEKRFTRVAEVSVREPTYLEGDDGDVVVTAQDPGPYRVRLCVDDSRFPTRLHVQSWPAPLEPGSAVRAPITPEPEEIPPDPALFLPEVPAGVAAAARIGNDVDGGPGARTLSGEVGTAIASIVLPHGPAWHGKYFGRAVVWTRNPDRSRPDFSIARPDPTIYKDYWDTVVMKHDQQTDRITGWHGAMWSQLHPDDAPRRRRMYWWRWVRRIPPAADEWPRTQGRMLDPVLPSDTLVVVNLNRRPGTPVHTEIVVEHRDVPLEWVEDLTDWWKLQLALHARREA